VFNFGGAFDSMPLRDYTAQNATDGVEVTDRRLMLVTAIVVLDAAADTAATLSPMANTLISAPPPSSGGGGGGGSTGLAFVLALGVLNVLRRTRRLRARD
jgi:hypothetical protein